MIDFLIAILMYIFDRNEFNVADGWNFLSEFSLLHILWTIWMLDMLFQLIPVKEYISIGSQKIFSGLFRPIKEKINYKSLKQYIKNTAYKVMLIWIALTVYIKRFTYCRRNRHRYDDFNCNILLCV